MQRSIYDVSLWKTPVYINLAPAVEAPKSSIFSGQVGCFANHIQHCDRIVLYVFVHNVHSYAVAACESVLLVGAGSGVPCKNICKYNL